MSDQITDSLTEMYKLGRKHEKSILLKELMLAALKSNKMEFEDFVIAFNKQQEEA